MPKYSAQNAPLKGNLSTNTYNMRRHGDAKATPESTGCEQTLQCKLLRNQDTVIDLKL